ncbi:phospholipase D family protein [Paraburkholderia strydomiana]|uniref:phospholipase D-like domain-containing protein n=1 Tax=Paraburkholderia strydomiana TaxID=1245417 RepID=UPI0038B73DC2
MQLISNATQKNHRAEIARGILSSNVIILCSGWLKLDGFELLAPAIDRALLRSDVNIRIYSNSERTQAKAKRELTKRNIQHVCVPNTAFYFHSKLYYFEQGSSFTALVGSANMTYGGLVSNEEVSAYYSGTIGSTSHLSVVTYLKHLEAKVTRQCPR